MLPSEELLKQEIVESKRQEVRYCELYDNTQGIIQTTDIAKPVQNAIRLSIDHDGLIMSVDIKAGKFVAAIWILNKVILPRAW